MAKSGRQSIVRLVSSADAIAPYVRSIAAEEGFVAFGDIEFALKQAKRDGLDVSCASSNRSLAIILDRLCETL